MKKTRFLFFLVVSIFGALPYISAQDKRIPVSELPANSSRFISQHFENVNIVYVEKERHKYEVKLSNGTELDFFNDGTWKNIEGKGFAIPLSIIQMLPRNISNYMEANYKGNTVTEVKKKRYGYEIELTNAATGEDIELQFDNSGKLLKIDD